jgi:NAD+ synthase
MSLRAQIVRWIADQVRSAGRRGAVFGLSGGLDSAVVGALCREAVGEEALGLVLPCHSLEADARDAVRVAEHLGLARETVDLSPVFDALTARLPAGDRLAGANLKPRLRMAVLYHYAHTREALVVGTGNRSELAVGYFTKHGDGGADLFPLGGLLKTEVRALAGELDLPAWVVERPPSAGLWEGQTDEEEMGVTYEDLDGFLRGTDRAGGGEAAGPAAERVRRMMAASAHKRRQAPVFEPEREGS